jgi:hypothetical protein
MSDELASPFEAVLRVEVARADLAASDARAALRMLAPVLEANLAGPIFDRAQESALVLAARAQCALGQREQALAWLTSFTPWVGRELRSLPPEVTPEGLRVAELQPLRAEEGFRKLVAELERRRKLGR